MWDVLSVILFGFVTGQECVCVRLASAVPCWTQGIFVEKHFEPDAQLSFSLVEEDPVTKQPVSQQAVPS